MSAVCKCFVCRATRDDAGKRAISTAERAVIDAAEKWVRSENADEDDLNAVLVRDAVAALRKAREM